MEAEVVISKDSMEEDDVKASRNRGQAEGDRLLRCGKKPKGEAVEDLVMDEIMQDKGEGGSENSPVASGLPEGVKGDLKCSAQPRVVTYRDKLLRLNGLGGQLDVEEDWISMQKREEEEADLLEGINQVLPDDPLCPRYTIPVEEHKRDCEQWRKALIIKMLGKRIGARFLMSRLVRLWCLVSSYELIGLDNGYLLIRFQEDNDYRHVLEEGPWIVNDHYVIVQRWRPLFDPYDEDFRKVAVWIRIPGLPIEVYKPRHLWRIGNFFGRTLKLDRNSLRKNELGDAVITERGKFARICVEVDLRKSFLSKFTIGIKIYHVGYEGLHLICFKCGLYGHRKDQCPEDQAPEVQTTVEESSKGQAVPSNAKPVSEVTKENQGEAFGTWMVVQRQARSRKLKAKPVKQDVYEAVVQDTKSIGVNLSIGRPPKVSGVVNSDISPPTVCSLPAKVTDLSICVAVKEEALSGEKAQRSLKSPDHQSKRNVTRDPKERAKIQPKAILKKPGVENIPPNAGIEGQPKGTSKVRIRSKGTLNVRDFVEDGNNMAAKKGLSVAGQNSLGINSSKQGVGKRSFPPFIRDLNNRFKVSVLALLEVRVGGSRGDRIINQLGLSSHFRQDPVGFSGGLWLLWDEKKVKLDVLQTHHQFVHTRVHYLDSLETDFITFIYGPDFTWKRGRLQERLDRACANEDWNLAWPNRFVSHLPFFDSDHRAILVANGDGARPRDYSRTFRFLAAWLTVPSSNVFRKNMIQKNRIYSRLKGLESYRAGYYDHNLEILQKSLWKELQSILLCEELTWFQRSRIQWLKYGDKNSKFFHSSTVARRRFNRIVALQNDQGRWITDSDELVHMAISYYQDLFRMDEECDGSFPIQHTFPILSDGDGAALSIIPSKEEIRKTIFKMGKFKAPGPDGLSAIFFHSQWDSIGDSVYKLIAEIFVCPDKVKDINGTLICHIPKKDSPSSMKDFRPISLCNVIYKAITKTLAERMRNLMPRIVSPNQCSFIKGRQGTDNIIIAQEVIHSIRSRKGNKGWMMIKVDLEKAYDRLSWKFVLDTLKDVGFPESTSQLILSCISTSSLSLLWNGVATSKFLPGRCIRQGDPISPYLFVLCIERLSHLINMAVDIGAWKPIVLRKGAPPISHLLFADDLIICAEASIEQAHVINQVLKVFTKASGQKVSSEKTRVFFSKNVHVSRSSEISESLGVGITADLGKYLGVPLHHKRLTKNSFKFVLDRVHRRLSSWNQSSLSLAGRSVLAKAVLEALPSYAMQSAVVPSGICSEIEKLTRSFIWGSTKEHRKTHLVSWKKICRPKKEGGLGFREQNQVNKAFSMKLGFGLLANRDDLWAKVLCSKYKVGDDLMPRLNCCRNVSNTWRGIQNSWEVVKEGTRISLGDGESTKFWLDHWLPCDGNLLDKVSVSFPEEFQHWKVAECVTNGEWEWDKFSPYLSDEVL
ncbi:uncharacterized protein LOC133306628 [Gastrolobium bilobum]|uniref:uncharacterized protein LOC133306628 n=1 Tax=Gastrolobium bilobum TaxID=150636 RepID=UPI002AAFB0B3|nr:uncharacterized protein LOC133306628 [Gastrolobium bilobum]